MKKQPNAFENYPLWSILLANLVSLSVYFTGLYILYLLWPLLALIFLVYVLYNELSVYREGCVSCYYYGKLCAFGRGKIAKMFLKKGSPKKFTEKQVSTKDFIQSSLVSIVPLIAGIYLLIQSFTWPVLIATAWPLVVWFFLNPVVYGEYACIHCKQARICCPVCEYFKKKAMKKK